MPGSSADWAAVSEHGTRIQSYDLLEPMSVGMVALQSAFPWGTPVIAVAVDGQVMRRIDPPLYDPTGALPEEEGLPFKDAGPQSVLLLIERITGLKMTPQWMLGPFMTAPAQFT